MIPDKWTLRLASTIATALRDLAQRMGTEPLAMLALDCHPWHGHLGLAALTGTEVAADKTLADPAEMAAWRYFDFARGLVSWEPTRELGNAMWTAYDADSRPAIAEEFLRRSAEAMSATVVAEALELFTRTVDFRLSVTHPDNGREFVDCLSDP